MLFIQGRSKAFPGGVHAFTLVEMLVVLAVLAILATLLIPAGGRVLRNANSAKDLSNLRQIGKANLGYAAEKDGRSVMTSTPPLQGGGLWWVWYVELRPYLEKPATREGVVDVFISPSDPDAGRGSGPNKLALDAWNRRSYSVNWRVNERIPGGRYRGRKMAALPPSKMIFLGNHRALDENTNTMNPDVGASFALIPRDWHLPEGTAQFVFLDGHVEKLAISDLRPGGEKYDLWGPANP